MRSAWAAAPGLPMARSRTMMWGLDAFRYVGKHRRATLRDVLALNTRIDARRAAMEALADDAEDLKSRYGV